MSTEILKLSPACKDILWGGTRLSREYRKAAEETRIAETWELSLHPDGLCRIAEGLYAGETLAEHLGDKEFPTLIKFIDAADNLSIQVHPAKTEMWVILDCDEGAELVYGLKDAFDEAAFRSALENGTVEALLRYVPVHKGDVFFIPSGLVHAIGKGILIAEIQQSSNITYRVYDYGRLQNGKPRELHIEQALSVIRDFTPEQLEEIQFSSHPRTCPQELAACPYFNTFRYEVKGNLTLPASDSWQCLSCIDGEGTVMGKPLLAGDTYFLEKNGGEIALSAPQGMTVLVTRV